MQTNQSKASSSRAKKEQKPKYVVPKGEENSVHVEIEVKAFDAATGEKKSKPIVQKFYPGAWRQFQKEGPKLGYWVNEVLFAPKDVDTAYENPDPKAAKKKMKKTLIEEAKALLAKAEAMEV